MENKILSRDQLIKYLYLMFDEQAAVELAQLCNEILDIVSSDRISGVPKSLKELLQMLKHEPENAKFQIKDDSDEWLVFIKQPPENLHLSQEDIFCWIVRKDGLTLRY